MPAGKSRVANFIIGGTEKAGTTSVFTYLSEHPQVCGAACKETDFFRQPLSGEQAVDLQSYAMHFCHCAPSVPIVMEASPGYLGEAEAVVPRMSALLPDVKLLFILRDPVERLYSSYNFHVGKLNITDELCFESYVEKCFRYERKAAGAEELGMDEWYLKALRAGRYADFLALYFAAFPRTNLKVMFFDDLRADPLRFMRRISKFLDIDSDFWGRYEFDKRNVTFSGSNRLFHRAAIYMNARAEPFLRNRPKLKRALVNFYKNLNQAREGYEPMEDSVRDQLYSYYRQCNDDLTRVLDAEIPHSWGSHGESPDPTR